MHFLKVYSVYESPFQTLSDQKELSGDMPNRLLASGYMNLPSWAADGLDFWKAEEEEYIRTMMHKKVRGQNSKAWDLGRKPKEFLWAERIVLALPLDLSANQHRELLIDWLAKNFQNHAYTWEIYQNTGVLYSGNTADDIYPSYAYVFIAEQKIDATIPEPDRENYFRARHGYKKGVFRGGAGRYRKAFLALSASWDACSEDALNRSGYPESLPIFYPPLDKA